MGQVALSSKHRNKVGKGVSRKLRVVGRIPGVLYGPNFQPLHLDIDEKEVASLVRAHGLNSIINLSIDGAPGEGSCLCMIKDVQRDVFQKFFLHVDLRKVDLNEKIEVIVPLQLQGEQAIRAKGGIIEQMVRGVRVRSLPNNIPDTLNADISALRIGQTVSVADVQLPEGVELAASQDPKAGVVNVFATRGSALYSESASA